MAKIPTKEKTHAEMQEFVQSYYSKIKKDKKNRFNKTLSLIPKGNKKILDYGCGWGTYSHELNNLGHDVIGIDLMDDLIKLCRTVWGENEHLKFSNKKIEEYPDQSFDMVLSTQVIEHVHNVGNYLSGINRVLKPKGQLIISLPNVMNLRYFLPLLNPNHEKRIKEISKHYLNNYKQPNHHVNAWDAFHFTILLASMGFKVCEYQVSEGLPLPGVKWLPSYLTGFFANLGIFKNFSYTMHFVCEKELDIQVKQFD